MGEPAARIGWFGVRHGDVASATNNGYIKEKKHAKPLVGIKKEIPLKFCDGTRRKLHNVFV